MADLYEELKPKSKYYDRSNYASLAEYEEKLQDTTTVYIGNLSFFTSQDSIFALFSRCGKVKDIKMGINDEGHPCGFCFVMYSLLYIQPPRTKSIDFKHMRRRD
jgi:nuclear cap-binding protein subunit 2